LSYFETLKSFLAKNAYDFQVQKNVPHQRKPHFNLFQILLGVLFFNLSPDIEVPVAPSEVKITNPVFMFLGLHKSKSIVVKLSALFMLDALGGSFILQSIMCDWFHNRYELICPLSLYSLFNSVHR
jgi:hypothetical protein